MRIALALLLVTGCGRVGFDPTSAVAGDGGGGGDGGDGMSGDGGVGDDGAIMAPVCGTTVRLVDNFTATTTSGLWFNIQDPGVTVTQGSGQLSIAFAASVPAGNQGGYYQQVNQDFTDVCATTRVDSVGTSASLAYVFFGIANGATTGVAYNIQSGSIYTLTYTTAGGVVGGRSATFDPVAHKYLRIREASGTYYWDTSLDGTVWIQFDSSSTSAVSPTSLRVQLGMRANTSTTATNAGTARLGPVSVTVP